VSPINKNPSELRRAMLALFLPLYVAAGFAATRSTPSPSIWDREVPSPDSPQRRSSPNAPADVQSKHRSGEAHAGAGPGWLLTQGSGSILRHSRWTQEPRRAYRESQF
jgi:hypothetical protein